MKVSNNLKQGSKEWLKFRGSGLGASDAPIVMGASPWTTRFELWAQKTNLMPASQPEYPQMRAMMRGTLLEDKARQLYIKKTGLKVEPLNVEHPVHSFLRASLDGIDANNKIIVEIKTPGQADLKTAAKGEIPAKYKWQLVQQMLLVPDAERLDYVTFDGEETIWINTFLRDEQAEAQLLEEAIEFWKLVETGTLPEVDTTDMDRLVKRLGKEFDRLSSSMQALMKLNDILFKAPNLKLKRS